MSENLTADTVSETDRQLLEQFLEGSQEAFSRLVDRHAMMVKNVCQRVLRNPSDSDDAFQATFYILAARAKSIAWQDSIAAWLHQVARRVAIKLRSNLSRRRTVEADAARETPEAAGDFLHEVGMRELGEILDKELEHLPVRFREVILLTQAEGLSRSEAATRLGISLAAVKDRLERGRELLQKRLIKRGLTLSSVSLAAWLIPSTTHAAELQALVAITGNSATAFAAGKLLGAQLSTSAALAQGVIKLMGLQKASLLVALLVSLITGGSIAYGFLQDSPDRFEEGLRGKLVRLSTGKVPSLTIELDEYNTLLDLDISQDAKVWVAYEATALGALNIGQKVAVRLAEDHRTINEIHAQGVVREGIIKTVGTEGAITIEPDDDEVNAVAETIDLSPEAIMRLDGLPASRQDLKPGMSVPLEFGKAGNVVHAIEAEGDPESLLDGHLLEIDLAKREILLAIEDEDDQTIQRSLAVDAAALLILDGAPVVFEQLKPGSRVKLRLDDTGQTIRSMKVESLIQD